MLFVKDARQKRTRSDSFANLTEAYYLEYHRLGISELRLVEIASTIGRLLNEGTFKPRDLEQTANGSSEDNVKVSEKKAVSK